MEALHVVGADPGGPAHEASFDGYVPLRVRSAAGPIGAALVRLGDFSRTLVELAVEPGTQRLRGVTLTSLADLGVWPALTATRTHRGPPVLATTFAERGVVERAATVEVADGPEGVVVTWAPLEAVEAYDSGRVRYLVARGVLAGVWCTGVTPEERARFRLAAGR
jgi:hypothetical protein